MGSLGVGQRWEGGVHEVSDIIDRMFTQQLLYEVDTLTPARLIRYASTNNNSQKVLSVRFVLSLR